MLAEFCEKLKIVSTFFSMMINIVAFCSNLPIKIICDFKSVFSNSICLLKSIAISLYYLEKYS